MNFGLKEFLLCGVLFYVVMMILSSILGVWKETTDVDRFEVISHTDEKLIIFDTKTGEYEVELIKEGK